MSALSAGVGAGLGSLAAPGSFLAEIGPVGRAIAGNVASQGLAVVTGLQHSFDWRSTAAAAVGAGVGQAVGGAMGMNDPGFSKLSFGEQFGARLVTGLAASTGAALARGGRVTIQQVGVDAFGSILGNSLVDAMGPQPESIYSLADGGGQPGIKLGVPTGVGLRVGDNRAALPAMSDEAFAFYETTRDQFAQVRNDQGSQPNFDNADLYANWKESKPAVMTDAGPGRAPMTQDQLRRWEIEKRNAGAAPGLAGSERAKAHALGVYDAGAGAAESAGYSFGVVGTPQSRAAWAIQTVDAGVAGITSLVKDPKGAVSGWWDSLTGDDPTAIRQATAQGTGIAIGVAGGYAAGRLTVPRGPLDVGIRWGAGIEGQGMPWENYLATQMPAGSRLVPNFKTFDFFDDVSGTAVSAKTLDTGTAARLARPEQIYSSLRGNIDAAADFTSYTLMRRTVSEDMIGARQVHVAVPAQTTSIQWQQIQRAIEYGQSRNVQVIITPVR